MTYSNDDHLGKSKLYAVKVWITHPDQDHYVGAYPAAYPPAYPPAYREPFSTVFRSDSVHAAVSRFHLVPASFLPNIPKTTPANERVSGPRRVAILPWISSLLAESNLAAILGDLDERYVLDRTRFGAGVAVRRYRSQLVATALPLLWAALRRLSGWDAIQQRVGR